MENSKAPLRLTQTVQKGGCAAKVAALELRRILAQVRFPPQPRELMVGSGTFDDAAIFRISEELALVQTLDFFTPIVDTARTFGQIAAANALSDVYAMGGQPKTALAIFAFPLTTMDTAVAVEVLQGASDVIAQSGAALVGGHTIDDDTMKFGLSVTGYVHPDRVWTNAVAKPGDALVLTKALGTGALTAALKRSEVTEAQIRDALDSMCLLNDILTPLSFALGSFALGSSALRNHIHAATDITGFGLAGHALNLARASSVTLQFQTAELPRFEKTMELLEKGFLTKAHRTNSEYVKADSHLSDVSPTLQQLLFDPQTSGGLLLAVEPRFATEMVEGLRSAFPRACQVGQVVAKQTELLQFL